MQRKTDSSDTLALTHESCLKESLTSVSPHTDTLKCRCVEPCVVGVKVSKKRILIEEVGS